MVTIDSVGSLVETIAERVRSEDRILWFRGHQSSTWDVQPSIWRDYDKAAERNFTNRFSSRAGTSFEKLPEYNDAAGRLSLMQHYGLPTRLLDWTRSPLIAAYFALEKYIYASPPQPEDASIWVLEPHTLNVKEGFGEVTPPIDANMCRDMLTPAFTHRDKENNKVMAVMAAERELRMFVQQGCFTIHSYRKPLNTRKGHEEYLLELRIPAEVVRDLAFSIDVCGFRQGDIFPDLEHLSAELKGIYRPKR
jgi:hypothetical protein